MAMDGYVLGRFICNQIDLGNGENGASAVRRKVLPLGSGGGFALPPHTLPPSGPQAAGFCRRTSSTDVQRCRRIHWQATSDF